ncbi:hypothetical protein Mesau_05747 [Mesorhizobium australicum WSM2073]|uniref:Uncharacterized protein n=3 Tax=Mesorhizobium TaxID=68287 RepID=L0KTJ9_MESAW|nr:hypothetical protein Mesci_5694 [Mesorhizobium ciceri biovar biserrulae WSM1271]AEH90653.1 hypothetical protein Mesop_6272 [Mesorhizobium opportunistum WSM2075]AGB48025.1 hypothetical protein Mesau_05747 [Mesorhizobium australicum WSM2073]
MMIAPPGYVAIIVDLSRLVSSGRQSKPGADEARFLEVVRLLNAVTNEVAVIAPTPAIDTSI